MLKSLVSALLLALVLSPALLRAEVPVQVVQGMDAERYTGTWFEIARFPNRFQKQCAGDVSANYSLQPDQTLRVANKCRLADGQYEEAIGVARQADRTQANTKLKVRFAPSWLSWLPFVWADYWVIALDPDYRYALVGTPDHEYLWILSRSPALDAATYDTLVDKARIQGYDTTRLQKTSQTQQDASN